VEIEKLKVFLNLPKPSFILRGLTNQLLYLLSYASLTQNFDNPGRIWAEIGSVSTNQVCQTYGAQLLIIRQPLLLPSKRACPDILNPPSPDQITPKIEQTVNRGILPPSSLACSQGKKPPI